MARLGKHMMLAALAVGLTMVPVLGFVNRHHLAGWWKCEASYKGKYTCEWNAEIKEWSLGLLPFDTAEPRVWRLKPSRAETSGVLQFPDVSLLNGDPEAIPVLLELLTSDDSNVRFFACMGLGKAGAGATAAVQALQKALKDPDPSVRDEAEWELGRIGGIDP